MSLKINIVLFQIIVIFLIYSLPETNGQLRTFYSIKGERLRLESLKRATADEELKKLEEKLEAAKEENRNLNLDRKLWMILQEKDGEYDELMKKRDEANKRRQQTEQERLVQLRTKLEVEKALLQRDLEAIEKQKKIQELKRKVKVLNKEMEENKNLLDGLVPILRKLPKIPYLSDKQKDALRGKVIEHIENIKDVEFKLKSVKREIKDLEGSY